MVSVHKLSQPQLQRLIRHVTLALLLDVLRQGRMRRPAEPDARHGSLVCRMEHFVAGRQLVAAVALNDDDPGVLVVTVIDLEE